MTITNNTDFLLSADSQQVVRAAMAWADLDKVFIQHIKGEDDNLFHVYSDEDFKHYEFSIDTDADGETIIWNK